MTTQYGVAFRSPALNISGRRERGWMLAVAVVLLGACSDSTTTQPSASTNAFEPAVVTTATPTTLPLASSTTQTSIDPTTTLPAPTTSVTVEKIASTTTAVTQSGPLEFVDGKFVGIAQGSLLSDAARALGLTPVRLTELDQTVPVFACTGTPDPWVIRSGGLTLVFESPDDSSDNAVLTNWRYIGGPVAGFTEMVLPHDIRIGDARDTVEAAYPDFGDLGDELEVSNPFLRIGVPNDVVGWFGIIDCAFESEPTD